MEKLTALLQRLTELPGAPGFESAVVEAIFQELRQAGLGDECLFIDNMGNAYVKIEGKNPEAPIIHLDAHSDEPCFITQYIDESGRVYIAPLGLISENIMMGQRVAIITKNGPVKGCFGVRSYHLSSNGDKTSLIGHDDIWIDIGASSREQAAAAGVKPGFPVVFDEPFVKLLGNNVMAKAFDNRVGCATLLFSLLEMVKNKPESTVFATFTAQEELILRGSRTVYCGFQRFFGAIPKLCIAYDISLCGDVPGIKKNKAPVELGKGVGVKLYDKSSASHYAHVVPRVLVEFLEKGCEELGLPYQYDFLMGCTNADLFALEDIGILTGGISLPCRYTHSAVEIVNLDDVMGAVALTLYTVNNAGQLFG